MIRIRFPDAASERRALGYLAGRFSFKSWADGVTLVPDDALAALARASIPFITGVTAMTVLSTAPGSQPSGQLEADFQALVGAWRQERGPTSSTTQMAMCPSYQRIIGLGPAVVPLLLRELEQDPDHWFWALKAITGADPVPIESRGKLAEMARYWVDWGRQQGYRW
jgi:hypothetical protein